MSNKKFWSVPQIAEECSVSTYFVRKTIREHRFPITKVGRNWRIKTADVDALMTLILR